jgi:hypothetical protein
MNKTTYFYVIFALFLAICGCRPSSKTLSFPKAYKKYQRKGDYAAASAAFGAHFQHPKYGAAARFFWAKNTLRDHRALRHCITGNTLLLGADSLQQRLIRRRSRQNLRRYGVDSAAIQQLRLELQRWAMADVRARGSIHALDSLLHRFRQPMQALQADLDSTRSRVVNDNLGTEDFDVMSALLYGHTAFVLPANYPRSRQLQAQIWPAFQAKYSYCGLDTFVWWHPRSFVAQDCWWKEAKVLLCRDQLSELLDFQRENRWTAMETVILNKILEHGRRADTTLLSTAQRRQLADLQARANLRERLRRGAAGRDSSAVLRQALAYISAYAPRYTAFSLMEETLMALTDAENFGTAAELLEAARPFFPDTLPAACASNFDYQRRARPYIDGRLPILLRHDPPAQQSPLAGLNTPEGDEFSPVYDPSARQLYFAGAGRADNLAPGSDVFVSQRDNEGWSAPRCIAALSGAGNQRPLSLTADGQEMLLQSDGKLMLSRKRGNDWTKPRPLPLEGLASIGGASLSGDGKVLVLSGALSNGSALQAPDMDIFVAFRTPDGQWGEPIPLGSDINTDGTEDAPFLSADAQSLFFTSTEFPGLGSSDVFVARRNGPEWAMDWSKPQNLGKALNDTGPHAGLGFVSADERLFFFARYPRSARRGDIFVVVGGKW